VVTTKFECLSKGFVIVRGSVNRSPPATILPFFVEDPESVFDWDWFCKSPL
jgi:hypothetical protein